MENRFMTVPQLSEYLKMSLNHTYQLIHRDDFKHMVLKVSDRKYLIDRAKLEEWIGHKLSSNE